MNGVVPETLRVEVGEPPARWKATGWRHLPLLLPAVLVGARRVGPRVAAATWLHSIAAFVVVLLIWGISAALIAVVQLDNSQVRAWLDNRVPALDSYRRYFRSPRDDSPTPTLDDAGLTFGDRVRMPFAAFVNDLYAATGQNWDFSDGAALLAGLVLVVVLAPNVLLPAVARHLPPRRRYGRCLKLALWASACVVPATLAVAVAAACADKNSPVGASLTDATTYTLVAALTWAWFTKLVIALGERPATAEEAEAGGTIEPRCNACGYLLTGLYTTSRCPECGLAVAASLPVNRALPAWALARGFGRPRAWLRTARAVIGQRDFFQRVAVDRGAGEALGFAAYACLICGLLFIPAMMVLLPHSASAGVASMFPVVLLAAAGVALMMMWSTLGMVSIVSRTCRRSPTAVLIAGCYASVLAIPVVAIGLIAVCAPYVGLWAILNRATYGVSNVPLFVGGRLFRVVDVTTFAWGALVVLAIALAVRRTLRGMREVRFAGA